MSGPIPAVWPANSGGSGAAPVLDSAAMDTVSAPAVHAPDRATVTAFVGAVLIGGVNFLAVKFSNEELTPMFGATLRFAAAALLFLIAGVGRVALPRGRAFWGAAVYGFLGFGIAYALIYYALVGLTAGTTSVVMASVPLVTLILAVVHRQERFSIRGVVGGLLAMAGIALLSTGSLGGEVGFGYFFSALLGVVAVAESSVVIKSFPSADPIATNAVGMGVGTVFLALFSFVLGEPWVLPQASRTWLALGWLVVAGSVGLFILYLYVMGRWAASATNYAVTLMPVVAVTLGAVFANEAISWQLIVGGGLVLMAVYAGALSREKESGAAAEAFVR